MERPRMSKRGAQAMRSTMARFAFTCVAPCILAVAFPLLADSRFEVRAFRNGEPVREAEVCFFKGSAGDDFIDRFLSDDETRCYPADRPLRVPPGVWNYYVVDAKSGWVSAHPNGIESASGDADLKPMVVELLPAATLSVERARASLQTGEYFAVYLSNDRVSRSRPAVRPVPRDSNQILVPSGVPFMPLIIRDRSIVWAGPPVTATRGERRALDVPVRPGSDLVALVSLDAAVMPADRQAIEGSVPPAISLAGGGRKFTPVLPLRPAPMFDTSLVIFRDVPPGDYTLELSGDYWLSDSLRVAVRRSGHDIAQPSRALVTRPRARIEARWSLSAVVAAAPEAHGCDATAERPTTTTLTLSRCLYGFEHTTTDECRVLRNSSLGEDTAGTVLFDKLESGDYRLVLERGALKAEKNIRLGGTVTAKVSLDLQGAFLFGRVTRAGKPVKAVITANNGQAISDGNTGDFQMVISRPALTGAVVVTACDTRKEYVEPGRQLAAGDRYDIDIPSNRLTIRVSDAANGRPLLNARVTNRIVTSEHTLASRFVGSTMSDGTVTDEDLAPDAVFEVCVAREGYERACRGDVKVSATGESSLAIGLQPSGKRVVRFVSQNVGAGRVYVALDSTIIGESLIEHGEAFRIDPSTPPNARLYVAALNYPLTQLAIPNLSVDSPEIVLPPPSGVELSITLPAVSAHNGGMVGLEMNGAIVPSVALNYYQAIHQKPPAQIRRGETIQIAPVASSAMVILLWHWISDLPPEFQVAGDPFANAAAVRRMYRLPVTGTDVILKP